jgi:hypothetical protein
MIATHHPTLLLCERKGIPTLSVVNSQGTDFNRNLTRGSRGKSDGATLARQIHDRRGALANSLLLLDAGGQHVCRRELQFQAGSGNWLVRNWLPYRRNECHGILVISKPVMEHRLPQIWSRFGADFKASIPYSYILEELTL